MAAKHRFTSVYKDCLTWQQVYRGISGGVLPAEFWKPNEFNVKGGVEFAFLSATTDYNIALSCETSPRGIS